MKGAFQSSERNNQHVPHGKGKPSEKFDFLSTSVAENQGTSSWGSAQHHCTLWNNLFQTGQRKKESQELQLIFLVPI